MFIKIPSIPFSISSKQPRFILQKQQLKEKRFMGILSSDFARPIIQDSYFFHDFSMTSQSILSLSRLFSISHVKLDYSHGSSLANHFHSLQIRIILFDLTDYYFFTTALIPISQRWRPLSSPLSSSSPFSLRRPPLTTSLLAVVLLPMRTLSTESSSEILYAPLFPGRLGRPPPMRTVVIFFYCRMTTIMKLAVPTSMMVPARIPPRRASALYAIYSVLIP